MIFDTASSALPHIKSGKVRALAVTGSERLRELPNVPTFSEQRMKDFDVPVWYGVLAPTGTPAPVVEWLNKELNTVITDPEISQRLYAIGAAPAGGTTAQMGDVHESAGDEVGSRDQGRQHQAGVIRRAASELFMAALGGPSR